MATGASSGAIITTYIGGIAGRGGGGGASEAAGFTSSGCSGFNDGTSPTIFSSETGRDSVFGGIGGTTTGFWTDGAVGLAATTFASIVTAFWAIVVTTTVSLGAAFNGSAGLGAAGAGLAGNSATLGRGEGVGVGEGNAGKASLASAAAGGDGDRTGEISILEGSPAIDANGLFSVVKLSVASTGVRGSTNFATAGGSTIGFPNGFGWGAGDGAGMLVAGAGEGLGALGLGKLSSTFGEAGSNTVALGGVVGSAAAVWLGACAECDCEDGSLPGAALVASFGRGGTSLERRFLAITRQPLIALFW